MPRLSPMLALQFSAPAPATLGILEQVIAAILSIVVHTLVWGVLLKFLLPVIAKKPVDWPAAFSTGATIGLVNVVFGLVLGLIHPEFGLLFFPIGFLVAMFAINRTRNVSLPQSALITLVGMVVVIVVMLVVGAVAVAIGMAK